jgi:hypothetical protein
MSSAFAAQSLLPVNIAVRMLFPKCHGALGNLFKSGKAILKSFPTVDMLATMKSLAVLLCGLAIAPSSFCPRAPVTEKDSCGGLRQRLSSAAEVHCTSGPKFNELTSRWDDFTVGSYDIVALPATADDVSACVSDQIPHRASLTRC